MKHIKENDLMAISWVLYSNKKLDVPIFNNNNNEMCVSRRTNENKNKNIMNKVLNVV